MQRLICGWVSSALDHFWLYQLYGSLFIAHKYSVFRW